jgi:Ni,Fe-hydrogenase I small subunit
MRRWRLVVAGVMQSGSFLAKIQGSVKEKEKIYSLLLVEGKVWSCSDERYSKCVIRIWDAHDVRRPHSQAAAAAAAVNSCFVGCRRFAKC